MIFICYEKCTTCRKAEKWLEENGFFCKKRSIQMEKPTLKELQEWHVRSGLPVRKLFNTSGQLYRSLDLKNRLQDMNEQEQLKLLATNGMLVRRPVLITDEKVLFGFHPDDWRNALKPDSSKCASCSSR